ncbi:MAG: M55 family metallopeptidase [Planctomycetes bacterium]|nr:M55 family metallopeptidase [Planctomycetota bacterium]
MNRENMKIWMMTDLEGVSGVVDFESQTDPTGKYYEESKSLLTHEVNAAVDGAISAGATDILVLDGHGVGGINYKELHPAAKVFLGKPVSPTWLLDETYSAVFLLGHHAMAGVENGNLNHTSCEKSIVNVWLNGKRIGEIGMEIILAGCFNVPAVLITGDRAACEEAGTYVPGIEVAVVKEGINRTSAVCLSKEAARALIKEKAKKALDKMDEIKPYKINGPFELITEYVSSADTWGVYEREGIEKVNSRTTKIKADKFLDLLRKRQ